jgi:hypothetical protein
MKEIVENVLADAAGEAAAKIVEIPKGRTLLSPDGTAYTKG